MKLDSKLRNRILAGHADANVDFSELCRLLTQLGFTLRVMGSHHIFAREGIEEIINLQAKGSKAKAYQVKQVRDILVKYRLGDCDAD